MRPGAEASPGSPTPAGTRALGASSSVTSSGNCRWWLYLWCQLLEQARAVHVTFPTKRLGCLSLRSISTGKADSLTERSSIPWFKAQPQCPELSESKARRQKPLLGFSHGCRVQRTWAIFCSPPRPQQQAGWEVEQPGPT